MDLTVKQLSIVLGISPHKIYRLINEKKIPHRRVAAGKRRVIRFDREALRRWLSEAKGEIGKIKIPEDALERLARMDRNVSPLEMERIVTEIRKIKREIDKIPKIRQGGDKNTP